MFWLRFGYMFVLVNELTVGVVKFEMFGFTVG